MRCLIVVLLLNSQLLHAQWSEMATVESKVGIELSTVDNKGNLYLVYFTGDVVKYNASGDLLVEYSAAQQAEVHQIQVTTQLKVVLFYQNLQEYLILNRYLSVPTTYRFSDFDLGFVSEVASSYQQNIWVVDLNSFSMKMIDPSRNVVLEEKSLAQVLNQDNVEIVDMMTHQNKMYLATQSSGVLIFDNMGNYQTTLDDLSLGELRFWQDDIYYVEKDQLVFRNLYSHDIRKYRLPAIEISNFWFFQDRLYVIGGSGFKIYKYLSGE
ncbi:MAG: hypothetical protein OCD76_03940 [Reichenbachiella sp.]